MQKKNDLQASFKSRKDKPILSDDDIHRIAEQVEKPVFVDFKPTLMPTLEVHSISEEDGLETIKTSLEIGRASCRERV